MKFHYSPETEKIGRCDSPENCPYGPENVFDSPREARAAHERDLERKFQFLSQTKKRDDHSSPLPSNVKPKFESLQVQSFKDDLVRLRGLMETYSSYRRKGLDENEMVPLVPQELTPYVNRNEVWRAWKREDYRYLKDVYSEAHKRYYLNSRFSELDVDQMPSDAQIEEILEGDYYE